MPRWQGGEGSEVYCTFIELLFFVLLRVIYSVICSTLPGTLLFCIICSECACEE